MAVAEHVIKGKKFGEYRQKAVFDKVVDYLTVHGVEVNENL